MEMYCKRCFRSKIIVVDLWRNEEFESIMFNRLLCVMDKLINTGTG